MVEIRPVTLDYLKETAQGLFEEHWAEVGHSATLPVSPLWPRFYAIEMGGGLVSLGAFVDGKLVGYCVTFVGQHHHCKELLHATVDVVLVQKQHRRKGIAQRLIRETEIAVKAKASREIAISWHAPQGGALEAVLCRMGYRVREVVYERTV